jgi:hypothetical protein
MKIILDIYASKVFQWHKQHWIWTNFISYTFFSNIWELNSWEKLLFRATKFLSPQRNWSPREAISSGGWEHDCITILYLHLIHDSCLMFATHKQCTMNSPNHNPKYNFLRVWKGYWSRFLRNTLHYYSPQVGSSSKYFEFQNHWLWDKGRY